MSWRAVILGFCLGLFISGFCYFNDQVIRQTFLIGNHLPISAYGFLIIIVLAINPLIQRFAPSAAFRPLELIVAIAIGLASCGWPGSSMFRYFSSVVVRPDVVVNSQNAWKQSYMMSYLPGGSPLIGEGHIQDWPGIVHALTQAESSGGHNPVRRIWDCMSADSRRIISIAAQQTAIGQAEKAAVLDALNTCIKIPAFYQEDFFNSIHLKPDLIRLLALKKKAPLQPLRLQQLNRLLIESIFPGKIFPTPAGNGVLLANGDGENMAVVDLMQGVGPGKKIGIHNLHLCTWWPSIRFWGLLTILFGCGTVCLSVIFQPQWKRELLPFPMARFVMDLAEKGEKGFFPKVAQSKLFWYGFCGVAIIHLINGTYTWFPNFIHVPLTFDFSSLKTIAPVAFGEIAPSILNPTFVPTAVAFTFFLNTQASFSVGISAFAYGLLFSFLVNNGISISRYWALPTSYPMMFFGSFAAMSIMILYAGRRYYLNVLSSGFGFRRHGETPKAAMWAFRIFLGSLLLIVIILSLNGVPWFLGLVLMLIIFMTSLVLTRINAETGVLIIGIGYIPVSAMCVLFGLPAIGPTAYIVMHIVTMAIAYDARENLMPFISNAFYMGTDRSKYAPASSLVGVILAMVVISFFVSFSATIFQQYVHGINYADGHAAWGIPTITLDRITKVIGDLSYYNELSASVAASGFDRIAAIKPDSKMLVWMGIGMAFVFVCSWMRMKFLWWPLHPVVFLVWGTWFPSMFLSPSILLGWAIKTVVMKFSGAQGYQTVKPFMIGVISGELIAGLFWMAVGAIYYFATGLIPKSYAIFPQ